MDSLISLMVCNVPLSTLSTTTYSFSIPNFIHSTSISPFSTVHFSLCVAVPPTHRRFKFISNSASGNDNGGVRGGSSSGSGDDGGPDSGDVESKLLAGEAEDDATLSGDVIVLDVGGMTCKECSASVKRILESQEFSLDGRFLVSAGRDFKIWVTTFPTKPVNEAHEIQSLCLGHTEVLQV